MGNKTTKIENARFIVTLDNGRRIIENGSIVIEDDRIESIGKSIDLKEGDLLLITGSLYGAAEVLSLN